MKEKNECSCIYISMCLAEYPDPCYGFRNAPETCVLYRFNIFGWDCRPLCPTIAISSSNHIALRKSPGSFDPTLRMIPPSSQLRGMRRAVSML